MHPAFQAIDGAVHWTPGGRTYRLRDRDVEALLDIFEHHDDRDAFLDLYDAHLAAGGIERVTSFRKAA